MNNRFSMLLLLACAVPAAANTIIGVTVTASSEFLQPPWDLAAIHLVDGSGLANGSHGSCRQNGTCWQNNVTGFPDPLDFNLGGVYSLSEIHVWNGYWNDGESARSANQVKLYSSANGTDWTFQGDYNFEEAPTSAVDVYPGFAIAVDPSVWSNVGWVRFDIQNNFGGGSCGSCVTMAEVQFNGAASGVPEPATAWMLLLGTLAMAACRFFQTRSS